MQKSSRKNKIRDKNQRGDKNQGETYMWGEKNQ